MLAERGFRIYWGPTLENALDFVYPVVGSSPIVWRAPRDGSAYLSNGTSTFAWVTGRYYRLQVQAQYFGNAQWDGGMGLQAFMDWAEDSNPFTLVPNLLTPAFAVAGCYLEGPFLNQTITQENDASQTLALNFLHPTIDLGLAWRGLFFEYAAGGSLTDPLDYVYNRTSVGYELNWQGYLTQNPAGTICDGHYPSPFGTGRQTTLLEDAVTNDVASPTAIDAWPTTAQITVTPNAAVAPDQTLTGDLVVESNVASTFHAVGSATWGITAADPVTALCFVRSAGRFRGSLYVCNVANTVRVGVAFDLHAGTLSALTAGTGSALQSSLLVPIANGWFLVYFRGIVDNAATTVRFQHVLRDASGNETYSGDGVSGTYLWGVTAVHGAHKQVASFTPSTSATDSLTAPWTALPQAQWDYAIFVDMSPDTDAGQTYTVLQTGATAFTGARAYIVKNVNTFTALLTDGTSSVTSSVAASSLNAGDVVEVFRTMTATGVVQIRVSVNGGAEQVGTASAALTLPAAWHDAILSIGEIGGGLRYIYGLAGIKSGPYVVGSSPATIADARLA